MLKVDSGIYIVQMLLCWSYIDFSDTSDWHKSTVTYLLSLMTDFDEMWYAAFLLCALLDQG